MSLMSKLLSGLLRPTQRDSVDQLRAVMGAPFERQRLLSRAELDLFRTIEAHLPRCGPGLRLMAQPSMGEFLSSPDPAAFHAINVKRVDMLVIDAFGLPILAVEHQGSGHYQTDAAARDAVKREALRKAGIEYLEIFDYQQGDEICELVSRAIARGGPKLPRPPRR